MRWFCTFGLVFVAMEADIMGLAIRSVAWKIVGLSIVLNIVVGIALRIYRDTRVKERD